MTVTQATWIRIGGQISNSRIQPFLQAIADAEVSIEPGEMPLTPDHADELLAAMREGYLVLGDVHSPQGKFPELEQACRNLGLSYTRFAGAATGCDAELVDWRPTMKEPLIRVGSSADWDRVLIDVSIIQQALSLLYAGHVQHAIHALAQACPTMSPLPPFEIV